MLCFLFSRRHLLRLTDRRHVYDLYTRLHVRGFIVTRPLLLLQHPWLFSCSWPEAPVSSRSLDHFYPRRDARTFSPSTCPSVLLSPSHPCPRHKTHQGQLQWEPKTTTIYEQVAFFISIQRITGIEFIDSKIGKRRTEREICESEIPRKI